MMKKLFTLLLLMYWLAVGYLPYALNAFLNSYRKAIGCRPHGDCYVPGSEHLFALEMLLFTSALLLWPLVAIKLFTTVRSLIKRA